MAEAVGFLLLRRETWTEFLSPRFSPAQCCFCGRFGEELAGGSSLLLPSSLFSKNKLKIIFKKTNIPAWKHCRIPSNKISRDRKGCQQPAFLLLIDEQTGTRGGSGQCASGRLGQCGAV